MPCAQPSCRLRRFTLRRLTRGPLGGLRVIHTPGHSMGSVSVLLETGDALVGDLAMTEFPLRFSLCPVVAVAVE